MLSFFYFRMISYFNVTLAICVFSLMNVYMMNIHVMLSVVQDDTHMIQYVLDM